jgi:hypothetical protein
MKRVLLNCAIIGLLFGPAKLLAADADLLAGKWMTKKTNEQGQTYNQTIEIKKDKFVFQILGADGQSALYAEGSFKVEKMGPFNVARFSNIRGGTSSTDLQDVDDEHIVPYMLDGDTWLVASNFDKDRDQKPSLDKYQRVKNAAQAGTLVIDEIEMADTPQSATWYICFEATIEGKTRRHYVENKGYDKNKVTIPIALELPKAQAGQKCTFKVQLDDVDGDACSDEVDNRSTGEFTITEKGSQSYKPEEHWRYTIRWHLK